MKILVLVVTYNEADNISRLIPSIFAHLPDSSVLIVDDNSPDGTSDVVRRFSAADTRVQLICRQGARGYSSATIAGMQHGLNSGYDVIATLDADFSHDPADLPKLIGAVARTDVAIGSRYVDGIRVLNWDVRRLLLSLAANAYVRALSGLACADCTSGFRAYQARVLRRAALDSITTRGYAFLPELLFALRGAAVVEVPICFTERRVGESKMSAGVIAEALIRPWGFMLRRVIRSLVPARRRSA